MTNTEIDRVAVYTVEEAATTLRVSVREVYRLIQNKEIDCFYVGRKRSRRRIAAPSLNDFIQRKIAEAKKSEKS